MGGDGCAWAGGGRQAKGATWRIGAMVCGQWHHTARTTYCPREAAAAAQRGVSNEPLYFSPVRLALCRSQVRLAADLDGCAARSYTRTSEAGPAAAYEGAWSAMRDARERVPE